MAEKSAALRRVDEIRLEVYEVELPDDVRSEYERDPEAFMQDVLKQHGHEVNRLERSPHAPSGDIVCRWYHVAAPETEKSRWIEVCTGERSMNPAATFFEAVRIGARDIVRPPTG